MRRIADIFNRFSPSVRSAANGGGLDAVTTAHRRRSCRRPAIWSARSAA